MLFKIESISEDDINPESYRSLIVYNEDGNIYLHEQPNKIITILYNII